MEKQDMRLEYGKTLCRMIEKDPRVVALEADLSKSTMGSMVKQNYPEHFFDFGIAEANMMSAAAGMALAGRIPFCSSFAVFASGRCYDQIRSGICTANANVKIAGSSAGFSDCGDGATHQSIDDIALMRILPNMQVFVPADAQQTGSILAYMAEKPGPMYIRISRSPVTGVTAPEEPFEPGKLYTLRQGTDTAIVACGTMVQEALKAADTLDKHGISTKVINAPTVKPLSKEDVLQLSSFEHIFTAEEHSVIGGLGDAVSEILAESSGTRIHRIGVNDRFGQSAESYRELLTTYGLDCETIVKRILCILKS